MKKITLLFCATALSTIGAFAQQVVYLDFGGTPTSSTTIYNTNIIYNGVSNLTDNTGSTTGIALVWAQNFSGGNTTGPSSTTGAALAAFPDAALTSDFVYGSSANLNAAFKLTGLDQSKYYNFIVFGSRAQGGDVKTTKYTLTGLNTAKDSLDASLNTSTVVTINNIIPDANSEIKFTTTKATTNTNTSGYYYLNAVKMTINTNITTKVDNIGASTINARIVENNLLVGDYTGIVKVYAVNGKLVANGQAVFGNMPLNLQKGIYIVDTTAGKTKLVVK